MTCRCVMCGRKNAGSNNARRSYLLVGIKSDEDGMFGSAKNKRHSRKVRRIRETLIWKAEVSS
jgi:hypothetical protein